jgi:hypothetical protein
VDRGASIWSDQDVGISIAQTVLAALISLRHGEKAP